MSYSPSQLDVARTIIAVGRAQGATNKEILSALETGLMESRLDNTARNKWGFVGWRQESPTNPNYTNRTNTRAQARRYFSEAKAFRGKGFNSAQLAAAVQRPEPSARGKYANFRTEAAALKRQLEGSAPQGNFPRTESELVKGGPEVDVNGAILDAFMKGGKNPLFTAARNVDSGAFTTISPDRHRINEATNGPREAVGGAGFKAKLGPGADRSGVRTKPVVLNFVSRIANMVNEDLTIGTGTRHSRMTVDNNVSAHWSGDAADIPAVGRRLIRLGRAALIAAGMPAERANKISGGLINYGGWQIIFNTHEGGDHTNHLHVGRRRG